MNNWLEETKAKYAGRVLDTGEMNYPDDSDFYAVVWCDGCEPYHHDRPSIHRIETGSTRYAGPNWFARVDATPEVIELAEKWLAERVQAILTTK
jgi:hypothetical protein